MKVIHLPYLKTNLYIIFNLPIDIAIDNEYVILILPLNYFYFRYASGNGIRKKYIFATKRIV